MQKSKNRGVLGVNISKITIIALNPKPCAVLTVNDDSMGILGTATFKK